MNGARDRFPILLLGEKLDLDDIREISYKEGTKIAHSMGLDIYISNAPAKLVKMYLNHLKN